MQRRNKPQWPPIYGNIGGRRGNRNARGPSGDLIKFGLGQFALSRCVTGLAHDLLHQTGEWTIQSPGERTLAQHSRRHCLPSYF
jgi:hypothetical protein